MLNKLEILNLNNYSLINDFTQQATYAIKHGMYGISMYPNWLYDIHTNENITNLYINIDNLNPRFPISSYIPIIKSLSKYDNLIFGYNIPLDFSLPISLVDLKEVIDYLMYNHKSPRLGINLSQMYANNDFKQSIEKIEFLGCHHIFLYYGTKKDYSISDLLINANWVLKNTNLNMSLFGNFKRDDLRQPFFKENKVKSIGTSSLNIFNKIL